MFIKRGRKPDNYDDRASPYAAPLKKTQASATGVKKKSKFTTNTYNENNEVDMSQNSYPASVIDQMGFLNT